MDGRQPGSVIYLPGLIGQGVGLQNALPSATAQSGWYLHDSYISLHHSLHRNANKEGTCGTESLNDIFTGRVGIACAWIGAEANLMLAALALKESLKGFQSGSSSQNERLGT